MPSLTRKEEEGDAEQGRDEYFCHSVPRCAVLEISICPGGTSQKGRCPSDCRRNDLGLTNPS